MTMETKTDIRPCVICKKALTDSVTTSFPLSQNFFKENNFVLQFIKNKIEKYAANDFNRLCLACYKNAENWRDNSEEFYEEYEELETITDIIDTCMEPEIKTEVEIKLEPDPLMPFEGIDYNKVELSSTIEIPDYVRLPNSRTYCLIKNCKNTNLKTINNIKRSEILSNQRIYVSRRIKICENHEKDSKWEKNLYDKVRNVMYDFSESQIMDMFKLLKSKKFYFSDFVPQNVGEDDDDDE